MKTLRKKLSVKDVWEIRTQYKIENRNAINVMELAQRYGVSQQLIRDVARRRRYKNV